MKMLLTEPRRITAKSGKDWFIFQGISPSGEEFTQVFLSPEQFEKFELSKVEAIPQNDIQEFLGQYKPVEVNYNSRGRIDSIVV